MRGGKPGLSLKLDPWGFPIPSLSWLVGAGEVAKRYCIIIHMHEGRDLVCCVENHDELRSRLHDGRHCGCLSVCSTNAAGITVYFLISLAFGSGILSGRMMLIAACTLDGGMHAYGVQSANAVESRTGASLLTPTTDQADHQGTRLVHAASSRLPSSACARCSPTAVPGPRTARLPPLFVASACLTGGSPTPTRCSEEERYRGSATRSFCCPRS
ncbi:hypothetical protein B0I35DRAFT_50297 [Stachybotrys elegans]|uniref:Uncharacterized protein n=1 Tax=Stachybotrys elegans TaxID=80388 RepID=A0A8K0SQD3_9HYPO|nr:hypothetical protein B0I35DRAFT_50297 [Stachybotrys elegans]